MAAKLSTVIAAAPETDLAVVVAMASQFESYIMRGEVYRTVAVKAASQVEERVQSSSGDILGRLHKLTAQLDELSSEQKQTMADAKARIDEVTARLPSHYQALLLREARARLNSLQWYLDDCQENPRECRVQYPFEIRNRQRIGEIGKAMDAAGARALAPQLEGIDLRLRRLTRGGEFVWEASVAYVYPDSEYWYLYVLPVGPDP
ncbi:MAG: hypothetical protein OXF76_06980 [Caldilineaceae bacterium]|nr:hypothetical protein [Caldilineaceae bacterium]